MHRRLGISEMMYICRKCIFAEGYKGLKMEYLNEVEISNL